MRKLIFIVLALIVAIMPLPDELAVPVTSSCSLEKAKSCKGQFLYCRAIDSGNEMTGLSRVQLKNACFKNYQADCPTCGFPVELHCRNYLSRFQKVGPWWVKLFPGAESWWNRLMRSSPSDCELQRIEINGV
jgi:hypothetical protein